MQPPCPICERPSTLLDVVDFNKSCEEARGYFLAPSGVRISYFLCGQCGFAFAPEFSQWSVKDFESRIYNSDYIKVDPDYLDVRPRANAEVLVKLLGKRGTEIDHLDYGGGKGLLSELLGKSGWKSTSYDPFVDRDVRIEDLGKFGLITCFEVFEHVPDVRGLLKTLKTLLVKDGVVLFSTLLSDGNVRPNEPLKWWYASPRNGHISLFSRKSLQILCSSEGYRFGSFTPGFHAFWKNIPRWAAHFIKA